MITTNHQLITAICEKIFEAEERRLGKLISGFNKQHREATKQKEDGFLYEGRFYLPKDENVTINPGFGKRLLHSSLHNEMEDYLKDRQQVESEQRLIKQTFFHLLQSCQTAQHQRDALPECVIDYVPALMKLQRRDRPAWSIYDNPRALRQYEQLLPKIELYSATRLFY